MSLAGKRYFTASYESVLILTILHHIVLVNDMRCLLLWSQNLQFSKTTSRLKIIEILTSEILRLLDQSCAKEVSQGEVHTINPLSFDDNGKKLRLILDLRYINKHLWVQKFKCDDLRTFQNLFSKGDFFIETDLKSRYHHLDILEGHQKYLGFSWCISGMQR